MPFIRITVFGPTLAPEQVAHLQNETTSLMELVLGKVANLTSVLLEQPVSRQLDSWSRSGASCGSC